jgi:hypothetical protein
MSLSDNACISVKYVLRPLYWVASLRNHPEERRSQLHHGDTLKSRKYFINSSSIVLRYVVVNLSKLTEKQGGYKADKTVVWSFHEQKAICLTRPKICMAKYSILLT